MAVDDDFPDDDADKTILRPRPGGRSAPEPEPGQPVPVAPPQPAQAPPTPPPVEPRTAPAQAAPVPTLDSLRGVGENRLATAAAPLLALMTQLRVLPAHSDVHGLHQQIVVQIQKFAADAAAAGVSPAHVASAQYALCTALDEAVLGMPWGAQSFWGTHPLLSTFHKETWGGEKFFQILDRLKQEPASNLDLLELLYLCLALGFEGKYKIQDHGAAQLSGIQDELYRLIRQYRGEFERRLSPHWQGVEDKRNPLVRYVPLWVVATVLTVVLFGLFISFRVALSRSAAPIDALLAGIGIPDEVTTVAVALPTTQRLKPLLADPEGRGLLSVSEEGAVTTVILQGDNLFASGSAEVNAAYQPVLAEIGRALNQVPGPVRVYGHSDNVPIRSLQFQSNWELSRARAVDVATVLGTTMTTPQRLIPQGLADTRPVANNDTAEGRARNRRVEIVHTAQAVAQ